MSKCNRNQLNFHPLITLEGGETAKGNLSPGSDQEPLDPDPGMGY